MPVYLVEAPVRLHPLQWLVGQIAGLPSLHLPHFEWIQHAKNPPLLFEEILLMVVLPLNVQVMAIPPFQWEPDWKLPDPLSIDAVVEQEGKRLRQLAAVQHPHHHQERIYEGMSSVLFEGVQWVWSLKIAHDSILMGC